MKLAYINEMWTLPDGQIMISCPFCYRKFITASFEVREKRNGKYVECSNCKRAFALYHWKKDA